MLPQQTVFAQSNLVLLGLCCELYTQDKSWTDRAGIAAGLSSPLGGRVRVCRHGVYMEMAI